MNKPALQLKQPWFVVVCWFPWSKYYKLANFKLPVWFRWIQIWRKILIISFHKSLWVDSYIPLTWQKYHWIPVGKDNQAVIIGYPYFKNKIECLLHTTDKIHSRLIKDWNMKCKFLRILENNEKEHFSELEGRNYFYKT